MSEATARPKRGNLVPLLLGQVLIVAAGFTQQIVLARYLGKADYGAIGFVLGVCSLFLFLANGDLAVLVARKVSVDDSLARRSLWDGAYLTAAMATLATACVVVYVGIADGRTDLMIGGLLSAAAMGVDSLIFLGAGVAQGLEKMRLRAPAQVTSRVVGLAVIIALLLSGGGIIGVFAGQLVGTVAGVIVMWTLLHRGVITIAPLRPDLTRILALLKETVPFAGRTLFGAVYLVGDVLILQAFHPDEEVGLYRSAAAITLQLPIAAVLMAQVAFPSMSRTIGNPTESGRVLGFVLRQQIALGVPIVVGGVLVAGPVMSFLFGEAYADATLPFTLLLCMVPLRFANTSLGTCLTALDRQPVRARAVFFAAAFNVVANLLVVPWFGAVGAAATTLFTDALLTIVMSAGLRGGVRQVDIAGTVLRVIAASLVMGVVVWFASGLHVLLAILAGMVTYAIVGYLLRAWSLSEFKRLRSL